MGDEDDDDLVIVKTKSGSQGKQLLVLCGNFDLVNWYTFSLFLFVFIFFMESRCEYCN